MTPTRAMAPTRRRSTPTSWVEACSGCCGPDDPAFELAPPTRAAPVAAHERIETAEEGGGVRRPRAQHTATCTEPARVGASDGVVGVGGAARPSPRRPPVGVARLVRTETAPPACLRRSRAPEQKPVDGGGGTRQPTDRGRARRGSIRAAASAGSRGTARHAAHQVPGTGCIDVSERCCGRRAQAAGPSAPRPRRARRTTAPPSASSSTQRTPRRARRCGWAAGAALRHGEAARATARHWQRYHLGLARGGTACTAGRRPGLRVRRARSGPPPGREQHASLVARRRCQWRGPAMLSLAQPRDARR